MTANDELEDFGIIPTIEEMRIKKLYYQDQIFKSRDKEKEPLRAAEMLLTIPYEQLEWMIDIVVRQHKALSLIGDKS